MSESIKSNFGLLATVSLAMAPLVAVCLALVVLMATGTL